MRFVYDTNILISAILSHRSSLFHCLQLAIYRIVQAVICQENLGEFQIKGTANPSCGGRHLACR